MNSYKYNKSLTATVYIIKDSRVLLHKHKKYNTWFPVGGHLEENELPHEAAIREAAEESGLKISLLSTDSKDFSLGLVGRVPTPFAVYHEGIGSPEEFLDFIYIGIPEADTPSEKAENSELRWFSYEELQDENEDIKIHIRNTAIACLSCINTSFQEKYFTNGIL